MHTIGLMSGTSMDGIDGVLARFDAAGGLQVLAHTAQSFTPELRAQLFELQSPGQNELHRAALAGNALSRAYAQVVQTLLTQTGLRPDQVAAVGAHGQTVRHQPGAHDGTGYTWQLQNPALLAELCGIDVVADFRSRDVAAGGQGAPLVPAFHQGVFGRADQSVAVLNIGGIANLSLLDADGTVRGFDCGPGNALLDHWCLQHTGAPFDEDGRWGRQGQVQTALLDALMAEPWLALAPPKSTGRDLFNPAWLQARLAHLDALPPMDVQATLAAFTVRAAADALRAHGGAVRELLVCGGGALNRQLMEGLRQALPGVSVAPTDARGLPVLQVEAAAFAWLAFCALQRRCASLPAVTGARGPRVLGAIYPR